LRVEKVIAIKKDEVVLTHPILYTSLVHRGNSIK